MRSVLNGIPIGTRKHYFTTAMNMVLLSLYKKGYYIKLSQYFKKSNLNIPNMTKSLFNVVDEEVTAHSRDGSRYEYVMVSVNVTLQRIVEPFIMNGNIKGHFAIEKFGERVFNDTCFLLFGLEGVTKMAELEKNNKRKIKVSDEDIKNVISKSRSNGLSFIETMKRLHSIRTCEDLNSFSNNVNDMFPRSNSHSF